MVCYKYLQVYEYGWAELSKGYSVQKTLCFRGSISIWKDLFRVKFCITVTEVCGGHHDELIDK